MAKKLKTDDIIEKGLFAQSIEETNKFLAAVKNLKKELKSIGSTQEQAVAKGSNVKSAEDVKKLNDALGKLKNTTKSLTDLEKEEARLKTKLNNLTKEQAVSNQALKRQTKEQTAALRDLEIVQSKEAGTLQKVAAESRILRREREKLNLDTQKGKDRLKEINAQLDRNNIKVKQNSDALKKQKMNVGNYTESVKGALTTTGLFSRQLFILEKIQASLALITKKNKVETEANTAATSANALIIKKKTVETKANTAATAASSLTTKKNTVETEANTAATAVNATATATSATATKSATAATSGLSRGLKILRIALISTGIGAIVVALGALIAALATTQRGADMFSKVLRPLSVIFQRFLGFIQNTGLGIFDKLKAAFENPLQAIKDLGNALKENIINRFKALGVLGKAISKIFSGEFTEGFKDLGNGVIQLSTGIEGAIDKIKGAAESVNEEIQESIRQGQLLDDLIKEFERKQIDTTVPLARQRLEFERLREIANKQTASDVKRIDALNQAEKIQRNIARTEMALLDLQIKRMKLEQSFNDTSREEELELARLEAQRLEQEAKAQKKINSLISLRTGIEKRITAEQEKQLKNIQKLREAQGDYEEFQKKKKEEARKEEKQALKESTVTLAQELDKRLELVVKSVDSQIKESQKRESELLRAAEKGNLLAEESIAVEKERQAKLTAEKEKALKKQKALEIGIAAINAYSNKSKGGDDNALSSTIADITTLLAFANNLPAFEDGGLVTGGEQIVRINEKGQEYVIKHDAVNKYGTDMLDAINTGDFSKMEVNRGSGGQTDFNIMMNQALDKVAGEFKKAVSEIPQQRWSMSEITGGLKEEIEKGNQLKSRHYRKQKRLS
jgi:hypothetical protein